jgi:hypothetical protein
VPVPVPRILIGLGSLSLEAEARDPLGDQKTAMIWGRGANALVESGRGAQEGDAYDLVGAFGGILRLTRPQWESGTIKPNSWDAA